MIISENIKVKLNLPITSAKLENVFSEKDITPLRWAIVAVEGDIYTVSVSYDASK